MSGGRGAYEAFSFYVITLVLILVALVAFAAVAASSLLLASFAASTFCLMTALRLWGRLGLVRLEAELSCPTGRLFRGETFGLTAAIHNRKPLPVWVRLDLARPEALAPLPDGRAADGRAAGEGGEGVGGESSLLPYESISGSWTFRAGRRGIHRLGPASIKAGDVLGLSRREAVLPFEREIVVYPALVDLVELDPPFRDYFGIRASKGIVEDPAWYEGTREYSGNRPARNIHWKASARLGTLQEKIYEPTSHRKIFVILEGEGYAVAEDAGGFEEALEIAASLASAFSEAGASLAIATDRRVEGFPPVLPLGRGPEHLGAVLELLARCAMEAGQPVLPLLGGAARQGAGYLVIARAPGDRTAGLSLLPAGRRDRVLFVFGSEGKDGVRPDYPHTTFAALRAPRKDPQ